MQYYLLQSLHNVWNGKNSISNYPITKQISLCPEKHGGAAIRSAWDILVNNHKNFAQFLQIA
jgi:hypothetical protein